MFLICLWGRSIWTALIHFPLCLFSSGKLKVIICSKAQFKRRLSYITMIHSDNSIDCSPPLLFWGEGQNKTVALIRNTCYFSGICQCIRYTNSGSCSAGSEMAALWGWVRPTEVLLRSYLPIQGPTPGQIAKSTGRVCNFSHMFHKEHNYWFLYPKDKGPKGKGSMGSLLSITRPTQTVR